MSQVLGGIWCQAFFRSASCRSGTEQPGRGAGQGLMWGEAGGSGALQEVPTVPEGHVAQPGGFWAPQPASLPPMAGCCPLHPASPWGLCCL